MTPEPRERPILFSGPMVRAIIDGRKTQTRRVVTRGSSLNWSPRLDFAHPRIWPDPGPSPAGNRGPYLHVPNKGGWDEGGARVYPRWIPGDRLYVREMWRANERDYDLVDGIEYRADGAFIPIDNTPAAADLWIDVYRRSMKWRPSIHMPKWAARVWLRVTVVDVERVQEISIADVLREGVRPCYPGGKIRDDFAKLWDSINAKRGFGWDSDPYVWVVEFEVISTTGRPTET